MLLEIIFWGVALFSVTTLLCLGFFRLIDLTTQKMKKLD